MRRWLLFTIAFVCLKCDAQVFQLNGSATNIGDDCYRLTTNQLNQAGSIWHIESVNLNENFGITFEVNLGCSDQNGADGIVFGLQNIDTSVGSDGGGIGFAGINPSVGFEFDTYQNGDFNDPVYDHVALILDGQTNHVNSLAGPLQLSESNDNVEDCTFHDTSIYWDASAQTLSFFFDCEERISYNIDLVDDVFSGNPNVFWGFTSATGGLSNEHIVCLDFFTEFLLDEEICLGEEVQLEASGGSSYQWTPATGLSATDILNPIASPTETTTYTVSIIDVCGVSQEDDVTVTVFEESSLNLGGTINECEGNTVVLDVTSPGSIYEWSTGSIASMIEVSETGTYEVNINNGPCPTSAVFDVFFEPVAIESIDTSICESSVVFQEIEVFVYESETFAIPNGNCDSLLTLNVLPMDCDPTCSVDIPTAFSPNSDGFNDQFSIITDCDVLSFVVINRWGNVLFESKESSPKWDGTFNGIDQEIGLYAWYAETQDPITNQQSSWSGNVTLLR